MTNYRRYRDEPAFLAGLDRAAPASEPILMFVHCFNTSTIKGVLRFAQIRTDFRQNAPSILFAWPSAADPRAYVYDGDSALLARDDLVGLIAALADNTDRDIAVLAHSMGRCARSLFPATMRFWTGCAGSR